MRLSRESQRLLRQERDQDLAQSLLARIRDLRPMSQESTEIVQKLASTQFVFNSRPTRPNAKFLQRLTISIAQKSAVA